MSDWRQNCAARPGADGNPERRLPRDWGEAAYAQQLTSGSRIIPCGSAFCSAADGGRGVVAVRGARHAIPGGTAAGSSHTLLDSQLVVDVLHAAQGVHAVLGPAFLGT